jgi:hypothetical protein
VANPSGNGPHVEANRIEALVENGSQVWFLEN